MVTRPTVGPRRVGARDAARSGAASVSAPRLGDDEFEALRRLVRELAGISLNESKRELLRGRLTRRLRELGLPSFAAYHALLERGDPAERERLVNAVTTNKTEFFREGHHFDLVRERLVPRWRERARREGRARLRIWSAACSTGEEPYTIAMVLADALVDLPGWDVEVLASDIDTDVLAAARAGVYELPRLDGVPPALRRRFFLRGRGELAGVARVRPELRRLVRFEQRNLVDGSAPPGQFDAIFCRNVAIYFDADTQRRLFDGLVDRLAPEGHLFVGHSECLHWLQDRLTLQAAGAYALRGGPGSGARSPRPSRPAHQVEVQQAPSAAIALGEVLASREPLEVKTLLGTCVAACLFDPVAGVGGMNHFLLPESAGDPALDTRYGVHAMEVLINAVMREGGDRRRLVAKLFGASEPLQLQLGAEVARRNARFAREFLAAEGIPLAASLLGVAEPLDVRFSTHTGRARVRRLPRRDLEALTAAERRRAWAPAPTPEPVIFSREA